MSEQKEKIRIEDFIKEGIKALGYDISDPITETKTRFICPKCNKKYNDSTKFCSKDGSEIIEETYEVNNGYDADDITKVLYALQNDVDECFGYVHYDNIEKRGDGDGYHDHIIFKRKSDSKFFYFYSYDGRYDECYELKETQKVVVESWDFERYFD